MTAEDTRPGRHTEEPSGHFTDQLWREIATIRAGIDTLPFVAELASGRLERERFRYYLAQDALYLLAYGRVLAAAATQSRTADDLVFWSGAAHTTMVVERELHATHVADLAGATMSPTCTGYASYLLALAASGDYPTLTAGVLPCFWIYEDVGSRIKSGVADLASHPYGDWISAYGDPQFAEATEVAKGIVDRLAAEGDPATRARMREAFVTAARYEWMFWDAAHRLESWPV